MRCRSTCCLFFVSCYSESTILWRVPEMSCSYSLFMSISIYTARSTHTAQQDALDSRSQLKWWEMPAYFRYWGTISSYWVSLTCKHSDKIVDLKRIYNNYFPVLFTQICPSLTIIPLFCIIRDVTRKSWLKFNNEKVVKHRMEDPPLKRWRGVGGTLKVSETINGRMFDCVLSYSLSVITNFLWT